MPMTIFATPPTGIVPACATALAVAVLAGCGSSGDDETTPRAAATTPATTETPAHTTTPPTTKGSPGTAKPTPTATTTTPRSSTTTRPKRKKTSPSPAKTTTTSTPATKVPASHTKLGKPQTFSGDGDDTIGTLALKRNAVVRWTVAGGGRFTVTDGAGRLEISDSGPSGQSFAASGRYRSVKVSADGRWTLSFTSLGT